DAEPLAGRGLHDDPTLAALDDGGSETLEARDLRRDVVGLGVGVNAALVLHALDLHDGLIRRRLQHAVVAAASRVFQVHRTPEGLPPEAGGLIDVGSLAIDQDGAKAGMVHPRSIAAARLWPGPCGKKSRQPLPGEPERGWLAVRSVKLAQYRIGERQVRSVGGSDPRAVIVPGHSEVEPVVTRGDVVEGPRLAVPQVLQSVEHRIEQAYASSGRLIDQGRHAVELRRGETRAAEARLSAARILVRREVRAIDDDVSGLRIRVDREVRYVPARETGRQIDEVLRAGRIREVVRIEDQTLSRLGPLHAGGELLIERDGPEGAHTATGAARKDVIERESEVGKAVLPRGKQVIPSPHLLGGYRYVGTAGLGDPWNGHPGRRAAARGDIGIARRVVH